MVSSSFQVAKGEVGVWDEAKWNAKHGFEKSRNHDEGQSSAMIRMEEGIF
jgi:hypothetical protein